MCFANFNEHNSMIYSDIGEEKCHEEMKSVSFSSYKKKSKNFIQNRIVSRYTKKWKNTGKIYIGEMWQLKFYQTISHGCQKTTK